MKLKYVGELEGLRGLMAMWVVIGHWAASIGVSSELVHQKLYNEYAVDVFIILSGFVISFLRDESSERYVAYITRRFFRLFPVYALMVIVSALLLDYSRTAFETVPFGSMVQRRMEIIDATQANFWPHLQAHLVLLHGLIPESLLPETAFAFVGQAWSISVEWQFYLLAPFLIGCILTANRRRSQIALVAIVLGCIFYAAYTRSGFIGPHLYLFIIGIGSFWLWKRIIGTRWQQVPYLRAALVLALPFMVLLGAKSPPIMIWFGALYLILASRSEDVGIERPLVKIFSGRPAQFLGRISYSLYLSHMLVITIGLHVLAGAHLSPLVHAGALLIFTVTGTILLSMVSYRVIEKPFIRLGKHLSQQSWAQGPAAVQRTETSRASPASQPG